jgi:hypothetical protein
VVCVVVCLGVGSTPSFAAGVSIPFITVTTPGGASTLSVEFAPEETGVSAIQFDVHYDPSALSLNGVAGDATVAAAKTVASAVLAPGTVRFLIAGFNQTTLDSGSLVDLTVQLNETAGSGTYWLQLSNVIAVEPSSDTVGVTARHGAVRLETGPFATMTVNGFHGSVTLMPDSSFHVEIAVDAGPAGLPGQSDLYVAVSTPSDLLWLSSVGFTPQASPLFSGELPTFGPVELFNLPTSVQLPGTSYMWFVMVVGNGGVFYDAALTIAP